MHADMSLRQAPVLGGRLHGRSQPGPFAKGLYRNAWYGPGLSWIRLFQRILEIGLKAWIFSRIHVLCGVRAHRQETLFRNQLLQR